MANKYEGTWRAWASMMIDGDERVPMLFRLWPEPWDNSIQYGSKIIWNTVTYDSKTNKFSIVIRDNGNGFSEVGEARFLQLASETDANEASRYGWGLKAFIASTCPNYTFDYWEIGTRYINTARPTIYKGPYKEKFTSSTAGPADMLFPSGTSISVNCDKSKFSTSKLSYDTAKSMASLFKEIVCTRYSEEVLRDVRFQFTIKGADDVTIDLDSWAPNAEWHSLEHSLKLAVDQGMAKVLIPESFHQFDDDRMKVRHIVYQINPISKKKNVDYGPLNDFPMYGRRTIDSTLIHHFNNQRMIEAIPKGNATGKRFHNSENGQIGFVQFIPTNPQLDYGCMPRPATIKTSYLTTTPEWTKWINMLKNIYVNDKVRDDDSQSSVVSEPADIVIPNPNDTLFADDPVLQKRYRAEKERGFVETYTPASWIGLPMGIKTINDGVHTVIMHRQKMKDVETDFMKAHLAACEYAHNHGLEPANVQFIILLSIKESKKRSERMEALRDLKMRVSGRYFPMAERIEFGLEA